MHMCLYELPTHTPCSTPRVEVMWVKAPTQVAPLPIHEMKGDIAVSREPNDSVIERDEHTEGSAPSTCELREPSSVYRAAMDVISSKDCKGSVEKTMQSRPEENVVRLVLFYIRKI